MPSEQLTFTLWDVGHGISIWVVTPNGQNHWFDLGKTPDFSPSLHVHKQYGVKEIDYLLVSHPDKDHLEDLPNFRSAFGDPRALMRNKSLSDFQMFGQMDSDYQTGFAELHRTFTKTLEYHEHPTNPAYNGGVEYAVHHLKHGSVVAGATLLGGPMIEKNKPLMHMAPVRSTCCR